MTEHPAAAQVADLREFVDEAPRFADRSYPPRYHLDVSDAAALLALIDRSTGPMDRGDLIERAARLLAETRDMAWDFEPGLSDDPYMRDARVLADAGLLCDMTPIQLGQTRLTGRSRDGEW